MLNGAVLAGFNLNDLELSPNYAGTLRGISSTFANTNGFFAPVIVGLITKNEVLNCFSINFPTPRPVQIVLFVFIFVCDVERAYRVRAVAA
jgi:hypothetical protein